LGESDSRKFDAYARAYEKQPQSIEQRTACIGKNRAE
jgi:hypothetical protein